VARRLGAGVVVICAAHFLIGADGLVVAIALPAMQSPCLLHLLG
jgi:hypothetical protein